MRLLPPVHRHPDDLLARCARAIAQRPVPASLLCQLLRPAPDVRTSIAAAPQGQPAR